MPDTYLKIRNHAGKWNKNYNVYQRFKILLKDNNRKWSDLFSFYGLHPSFSRFMGGNYTENIEMDMINEEHSLISY
jgi:hypothetical protein